MSFELPSWMPEWLFVVVYPIGPLFLLWLAHRVFQAFAPHWQLQDRDENMAAGGIASAVAVTGIVLAFLLSSTSQTSDTYQSEVGTEANYIRSLSKLLVAYDTDASKACQTPLLAYANSIVKDEWPALVQQQGSTQTGVLLNKLDDCLIGLKSTDERQVALYMKILNTVDSVAHSRETRIINSASSLSSLFWGVMHLGLLLIIVVTAMAFYTPGWIRVINCSIQIISLSLLFALVMVLDHPYSGKNAISNAPIVDAISHLGVK